MSYVGIDYGLKKTNIDLENNIRFGVIPQGSISDFTIDDFEFVYGNACPICGNEPKSGNDIHNMKRCPSCYGKLYDNSFQEENPIGFKLDDGEYKAFQTYDDTDIFIEKSPYFTYAQFCSPCAPGACHLNNPLNEKIADNKCYCFGHDFFEDNKAPYTVYSVETGEEIKPSCE